MSPAELLGLPADYIVSFEPQGSEAWHEIRRGVVTGSRAKDARDTTVVQRAAKGREEIRGPSAKQKLYARDLARQREHGRLREKYQSDEMYVGKVEEPKARVAYQLLTGCLVEEVGFVCTPDGKFGVSPDGLRFELDADGRQVRGAIEIKCMVGSNTLWDAFIFGDTSDYIDQILMEIWLLHLDWVDLVLWAPDLPEGRQMRVIRIERDEDAIQALIDDLTAFDASVEQARAQLRAWISDLMPHDSSVVTVTTAAPATSAGLKPAQIPDAEEIFQ